MIAAALYDWLLFGHIVAAMAWVGGGVVLFVMAVSTLRGSETDALARFVRGLRVVGPGVLAPGTVITLGLGVWLVLDSAAWDFGQTWVLSALGLAAAGIAIGAIHQSHTALAAERALGRADTREARRQLVLWTRGYGLILVLLVVIAWDMVFKPGF